MYEGTKKKQSFIQRIVVHILLLFNSVNAGGIEICHLY